jgi:hypothetical protein
MSSNDDGRDKVERLEQMKNEFLAAQQRRRDRVRGIAPRPDETGAEPPVGGPTTEGLHAVAVVLRP